MRHCENREKTLFSAVEKFNSMTKCQSQFEILSLI